MGNEILWHRSTDPQSGESVLVISNGAGYFYTFATNDDPQGDFSAPCELPPDSGRVSAELVNKHAGILHFIAYELIRNRLDEMEKDPIKVLQSVL